MNPWRSRITGYGEVAATSLRPNGRNWRRHPAQQRTALAEMLGNVGWVRDVIVNERTGALVDGHLRAELAAQRNETIPVVYVDLAEAEERLILATLDPLAAMAETDTSALAALLSGIENENDPINRLLDVVARSQGAGVPTDPAGEWLGMPAFEQDDISWRALDVHFRDADALAAFAALVEQPIGEKTRSLWYPRAEVATYMDRRFVSEP